VAARGEVLSLLRPVGFLRHARLERFLVVQADRVTESIETVLVAPMDEALPIYTAMPGAIPISAREAGAKKKFVAILTQVTCLPLERFESIAVGQIDRGTSARIDGTLRLVLGLA